MSNNSGQFELMKVANASKVSLIHQFGVKEIDLKTSLFEASANYYRRKHSADGMLGAVAKHLKAISGGSCDPVDDSLSVSLSLRLDKRKKQNISLGEKKIKDIALDLIKDEDSSDFVIITGDGQRIGRDELSIRTRVGIKAYGKSVDRDSAWHELEQFYRSLSASGAIGQ